MSSSEKLIFDPLTPYREEETPSQFFDDEDDDGNLSITTNFIPDFVLENIFDEV